MLGRAHLQRRTDGGEQPQAQAEKATPRSSISEILALQRSAGNAAVCEQLRRRPVEPGTVQRKIGFEFEIEVPAMGTSRSTLTPDVPDEMRPTYAWATSPGIAPKAPIHDAGYKQSGYKIEADEGQPGPLADALKATYSEDEYIGADVQHLQKERGAAKVEFITAALDETADDWETQFVDQLVEVREAMMEIRSTVAADRVVDKYPKILLGVPRMRPPLPVGGLPERRREDNLFAYYALLNAINFQTYMQATAGISVAQIEPWVQRDDGDVVGNNYHRKVVRETRNWMTSGILDSILVPVGDYQQAYQQWYDALQPDVRNTIRGFLALLVHYMVAAAWWQALPRSSTSEKNLAPYFAKLDLANYRSKLTQPVTEYLAAVSDVAIYWLTHVYTSEFGDIGEPKRDPEPELENIPDFLTGALKGEVAGFFPDGVPDLDTMTDGRRSFPLEFRSITVRPHPEFIIPVALHHIRKVREFHGLV